MQQLVRILNYTIPLGRGLLGIPVRISWLVIFVLFWWMDGVASWYAALFLMALGYGCIYLHEIGHALAIRYHNRPVSGILLWPLGGLCISNSLDRNPTEELITTLAGPVVNLLLAVPVVGLSLLLYHDFPLFYTASPFTLRGLLTFLFYINMFWASFNLLLPMFPMDGGRIVRALLARRLPAWKATIYTVHASFALAGLIGVLYLLAPVLRLPPIVGSFLFFIAIFGVYAGILEKRRIRRMPVYDSGQARYVVAGMPGFDTGSGWRDPSGGVGVSVPRKPGFLGRWLERRRRRRDEKDRQRRAKMKDEVERILEKISEMGIGSLTQKEKDILNRQSEEMRRKSG